MFPMLRPPVKAKPPVFDLSSIWCETVAGSSRLAAITADGVPGTDLRVPFARGRIRQSIPLILDIDYPFPWNRVPVAHIMSISRGNLTELYSRGKTPVMLNWLKARSTTGTLRDNAARQELRARYRSPYPQRALQIQEGIGFEQHHKDMRRRHAQQGSGSHARLLGHQDHVYHRGATRAWTTSLSTSALVVP
jgi:hypothetical protein